MCIWNIVSVVIFKSEDGLLDSKIIKPYVETGQTMKLGWCFWCFVAEVKEKYSKCKTLGEIERVSVQSDPVEK